MPTLIFLVMIGLTALIFYSLDLSYSDLSPYASDAASL